MIQGVYGLFYEDASEAVQAAHAAGLHDGYDRGVEDAAKVARSYGAVSIAVRILDLLKAKSPALTDEESLALLTYPASLAKPPPEPR